MFSKTQGMMVPFSRVMRGLSFSVTCIQYLVSEHANVMTHHLDEVFYPQASSGTLKRTFITNPNHIVTFIASMSGNLNLNKDFRNL
jgi:hypothetical protein